MLDPDIREAMEDRAHAQERHITDGKSGVKIVMEVEAVNPTYMDVRTEWIVNIRSVCPPPTTEQVALAAKAAHALLGTQPGELVLTDIGNRTVRLSRDTACVRRY